MNAFLRGFVFLIGCALAAAGPVYAQASLAGVVKDTSGAVLPGVTVEASSPALIEKVRSVATDGTGQYRIVDLRPGTYTVTFTLPGFSTVARSGIELTGSGTVTVNGELKVGSVEETVTVSGETPIVDVQSATRQAVLTGDVVASMPAARSWNGILLLMPGITGDPNTVQLNPSMITFGIHGGPTAEGRLLVDGMNVGASRGGGGVSGYQVDTGPTGLGTAQSGSMPLQYCHLASGFLTQFRGLGSYLVPKVDVEVSATFQSKPGVQLAANYNVPASIVAQSLGRAPAGNVANVTANLITPGTLYGDRVNEVDLRVAKLFRFARTRTKVQVDLFNLLNSAAVLGYNQTYSPTSTTWLTPTSVLAARVAKIGATFDF
jgi:hypothetical protein